MSRNVDHNKKFIRLFKSWKILWTHWYRSIKAKKYECFPIVFFFFVWKTEEKVGATLFFIAKKQGYSRLFLNVKKLTNTKKYWIEFIFNSFHWMN